MNVLLVNTSERIGGAAVACNRLMDALKKEGVRVKMLVRDKQTNRLSVVALKHSWRMVWNFAWERFVIWAHNHFSRENLFAVDIANTGTDITALADFQNADVIHLHWINQGMLSLDNLERILQSGKPVVWTMHDMWPCTGVCHHARTCDRYQTQCHNCFFLAGGSTDRDLSYRVFNRKKMLYSQADIRFVTCSQWLRRETVRSALVREEQVVSIPNPIDVTMFCPKSKSEARRSLGLPEDKRLILFGSVKTSDKRKGIDYLIEACRLLADEALHGDDYGVVIVGGNSEATQELFPLPVYALGYIANEAQMVQVYNAVDLYVTPSLEENLPNTIMESMACGTPCVGFEIGGIPEMIDHRANGYVAQYKNARDLADGICWTLDEGRYQALSEACVGKVLRSYSETQVAHQYMEVYKRALKG